MTDPSYDTRYDRTPDDAPIRTALDPIRVSELLYVGEAMLQAERAPDCEKPITIHQIVWRLIQEAVECDRAIRRPSPAVKSRSGPEVYYTRSEIWGVELQWAAENITYPPRFVREMPSAAAHSRYLDVMEWFRFVTTKSKMKKTFVQMLICLANGMPPSKAADVFRSLYYSNGDAVWAAKYRAVKQIADRLRGALIELDEKVKFSA